MFSQIKSFYSCLFSRKSEARDGRTDRQTEGRDATLNAAPRQGRIIYVIPSETRNNALTRLVIADIPSRFARGAEELVVRLKTRLLLLLLLRLMITVMLMVRQRTGMNMRTTARAVQADE